MPPTPAPPPLCATCRSIPFTSVFTKPRDKDLVLPPLKELWAQKKCLFCALIRHALATHYGTKYIESKLAKHPQMKLYATQTLVDPRFDWMDVRNSKSPVALYLEVHTRDTTLERVGMSTQDEFSEAFFAPKLQAIRSPQSKQAHLAYGRAALVDTVDMGYIREWLKSCERRHASKAPPKGQKALAPLQLLAIDTKSLCIVHMPAGPTTYIALSYMWGKDQLVKLKKANYKQLTTPGAFDKRKGLAVSRTIKDAIDLAQLLDCRYLWVDALCIIQDDAASIQASIGAMDRVYTEAWLTIVAAAGKDADGGLPGLHRDIPRRDRQFKVDVAEKGGPVITVANMLDSAQAALNFSTWNTRGWTYQERALSRRVLSFTHSQAYYHCDLGCEYREDMHPFISSKTTSGDDGLANSFNVGYELDFRWDDLFTIYASGVARYTQRNLTMPGDAVNAFAGILSRLANPLRGPFLFGLPVTLFDVGILWEPVGASKRRGPEFPSWSWAGWDGAARYGMKDGMINLAECVGSLASVETKVGAALCAKVASYKAAPVTAEAEVKTDPKTWTRGFDEDTLEIYYATKEAFGMGYKYPRPIRAASSAKGGAALVKDESANLVLKVRAPTATFQVSTQHSKARIPLSTCRQNKHIQCHLSVLDSRGRAVGHVLLDARNTAALAGKKHRFVALSRSTLHRIDLDPSWNEKARSFRPWTHAASGKPPVKGEDSDDSDDGGLTNAIGGSYKRSECFDEQVYNRRVFWPIVNVLMVSAPRKDGVVERVGIGKMHVDGFFSVAKEEIVLLR